MQTHRQHPAARVGALKQVRCDHRYKKHSEPPLRAWPDRDEAGVLLHRLHRQHPVRLVDRDGGVRRIQRGHDDIVYQFGSAMSAVDRMRQCSATGCNVGFTVYGPGITTTSFNSDWWFTKGVIVLPSTSGSRVSSDDGMWGGAPGMVNGNLQAGRPRLRGLATSTRASR